MNLSYTHLVDQDLHPQSRAWVYQCSRLLSLHESFEIEEAIEGFVAQWQSHGTKVQAAGYLFFGQFIILIADETQTTVSGCSTDSSVRFVKELEQKYQVSFFDRLSLAFVKDNKIERLPYSQVKYAFENNYLQAETLFFNNMVKTKEELLTQWIIPAKESWLAKQFQFNNETIS